MHPTGASKIRLTDWTRALRISFLPDSGLYDFNNSLCNIHARAVANALPLAALTEGATIRYRDRAMGVGKTRAARRSRTSGCTLQDCEKEVAFVTPATYQSSAYALCLKISLPLDVGWRLLSLTEHPWFCACIKTQSDEQE